MRERVQSKKQCAYYGVGESVIVSEVISEVEMHARGCGALLER